MNQFENTSSSRGARAPMPGARAPLPGRMPHSAQYNGQGAPSMSVTSGRTAPRNGARCAVGAACGIAKTALFGLSADAQKYAAQGFEVRNGGGYVLPGWLLLLLCIWLFLRGANPVFLAAAALFGILVVPIQASLTFMAVGGSGFGLSRFCRYMFNGAALAALLAGLFGFAPGCEGLVSSPGPVVKALIEEAAKLVFLLVAFCIGGRTVREYSIIAGAAVGAGFMAFSAVETVTLLQGGGTFIAFARNLPFGHVATTAILGYALYALLFGNSGAFRAWAVVLLALPILIHFLWVADIGIPWIVKYFVFGLISWVVAVLLLGLMLVLHQEWLSSAYFARGEAAGSFGKMN